MGNKHSTSYSEKDYPKEEYCTEHLCDPDENLPYPVPWSSPTPYEPCLYEVCGCSKKDDKN